jgi:23S rRNA pseudouridine1911/1915/1917 synthase
VSDKVIQLLYDGIEPLRLDKYLTSVLPDFSRSRLQGLIREGFATVDGKIILKTGQDLAPGQQVILRVPPTEAVGLEPEDIALDLIFENDEVMVINKPSGMVVHPAAGHHSGTLVHAALGHAPDLEGIGGELRPGVVHRLDKETSGIIVLAKNERAHRFLQDQFRLRQVNKVYVALIDGHPPTPEGRIEAPIGRDPVHRQRMAVVPLDKGREATTEYFSQERFKKHELVEAHPLTGRTHQIRVHLAFIHCPIAGDTLYGHRHSSIPIERFFLHAARLTVKLPGEVDARTFEAPLPIELLTVLNLLRHEG